MVVLNLLLDIQTFMVHLDLLPSLPDLPFTRFNFTNYGLERHFNLVSVFEELPDDSIVRSLLSEYLKHCLLESLAFFLHL